jgi:hypothetical protein
MKTPEQIKAVIADYFKIDVDLVNSKLRRPLIVKARRFWVYFLNQEGYSEGQIMYITGYDRTSLSGTRSTYRFVEDECKLDKEYRDEFFDIKDLLEEVPEEETEEDLIDKEITNILDQVEVLQELKPSL